MTEAVDVVAPPDRDGAILMPAETPVVFRTLVEQDRADRKRVEARRIGGEATRNAVGRKQVQQRVTARQPDPRPVGFDAGKGGFESRDLILR